ncbi:MAG: ferredoxin:thioredoxin reductase [Dehalococcoidia bacterium]|nr:ferredoxin:thioredoxin reductase [Dehalococcoidia bacterium]
MTLDQPTDADRQRASEKNLERMRRYARTFAEKSGTYLHPHPEITEFLVIGLAKHIDELGRPLCPCNFYEDKVQEARSSEWICACDEMQRYKYCHCLLFVNEEGLPITEYLPPDHEGREIYGLIPDPIPDKGRALGRLEEKQGRELKKGSTPHTPEEPPPAD